MEFVSIAFWIILGLWFLGIMFPYMPIILGVLALIIGIVALANRLR